MERAVRQPATGRVRIIRNDLQGTYYKGEEFDVYTYGPGFFGVANYDYLLLISTEHCEMIPRIEYKDMKFRITSPEHSEQLQKHLFGLGVRWSGHGSQEPMYTHLPYIFIGPRGLLEYTDDESVFRDLKCTEYTLQEEIRVKHTLVPVERRKTVLIGGQEVDEALILQALQAFGA